MDAGRRAEAHFLPAMPGHRRAAQAGHEGTGLALYAPTPRQPPRFTAVAPEGIDAEILRKGREERFDNPGGRAYRITQGQGVFRKSATSVSSRTAILLTAVGGH